MKNGTMLILVTGMLLVTLSCAPESDTNLELLIDWKWEPTYIGFLVARDKGFFEEEGLQVTIKEGNGATVANQLVASGKEKIASCSGAATIIGASKGARTVSLATIYPNTPTVFYSLDDTMIESPDDLVGKRVGLIPESISYHEYIAFCEANGISRDTIKEVNVGWDVSPLLAGEVDVLMQYEELTPVSLAVDGYEVNTLPLRDHGVQLVSLNIIANPAWYADNTETAEKVVRAVVRGYQWAFENTDEATELFLTAQPQMENQYVRKSLTRVQLLAGEAASIGEQDERAWVDSEATLRALGLIESPVDVKPLLGR